MGKFKTNSRTRAGIRLLLAGGIAVTMSACSSAGNGGMGEMASVSLPMVGLGSYTRSHAKNPNPPDRLGGKVIVQADQTRGSTRFTIPGPRDLDPATFGTPNHPIGWEQAPFPLVGIPPNMRQQKDGKYTIVDHATPFSDWLAVGVGDLHMTLVDETAIDGATTKDKVDFEATFQSPDKSHDYRVVAKKALPHGMAFPTFGGVVTDHLMHGGTGIGTKLMPTMYTYATFWAMGDIYVDGRLTNKNQMIHMMITESVRGDGNKLGTDAMVGASGTGKVLHLMIPPFKVGPNGLEPAPIRSGYIPFPEIAKRLMAEKTAVMALPKGPQKKAAMDRLMATKDLMMKTKKHVQEMMAAGKMFGQPFFHIMFGNIKLKVTHE